MGQHYRLTDGRIGQLNKARMTGTLTFVPCYIGSNLELWDEDHRIECKEETPYQCVCNPMYGGYEVDLTNQPAEEDEDDD